jgi:heme/copper-type cytochrome/quinol oxidase subunit 2
MNTTRLSTLTYNILAGPIVWAVHFLAVYTIAEFGCRANFTNLQFIAPATIQLLTLVLTIPALVLVAIGALSAYRMSRSLQTADSLSLEREADQTVGVSSSLYTVQEQAERQGFLIWLGVLLSVLFFVGIVATAAPALVVNICDWAA